jgi:hypothetical protein
VADVGDELHEKADEMGRDTAYERGRIDGSTKDVDDTGA